MGRFSENVLSWTGFGNDAFLQNDDLICHLLDNPEIMTDKYASDAGLFLDGFK